MHYIDAGLLSCSVVSDSLRLCSPPGSSIHEILILEWLSCSHPGDLPNTGIEPTSLTTHALAGRFFTTSATWEAYTSYAYYIFI